MVGVVFMQIRIVFVFIDIDIICFFGLGLRVCVIKVVIGVYICFIIIVWKGEVFIYV